MKRGFKWLSAMMLVLAITLSCLPAKKVAAAFNAVYNGIDYSPVFDSNYYVNQYSDLKQNIGNNPQALFNHFITFGMKEARQAKDSFNVYAYQGRYQDLRNAFQDNLVAYYNHYCTNGVFEGRNAKKTSSFVTGLEKMELSSINHYPSVDTADTLKLVYHVSDPALKTIKLDGWTLSAKAVNGYYYNLTAKHYPSVNQKEKTLTAKSDGTSLNGIRNRYGFTSNKNTMWSGTINMSSYPVGVYTFDVYGYSYSSASARNTFKVAQIEIKIVPKVTQGVNIDNSTPGSKTILYTDAGTDYDGKRGDGQKNEVKTVRANLTTLQSEYTTIIRCTDTTVRNKAVEVAREIAYNNKIGYSKSARDNLTRALTGNGGVYNDWRTLIDNMGSKNYDVDCSSFVYLCYKLAFVELGATKENNPINRMVQGNEKSYVTKDMFNKITYNKDYPKFFTVVSYNNSLPNGGLQKGDILVKGGHTIMVTGIE